MRNKHARAIGAEYDAWASGRALEHRCDIGFWTFTKDRFGCDIHISLMPDTLAKMNWGSFVPFEQGEIKWFDIAVNRDISALNERLVVIKELFHVHYDTPGERLTSMDVLSHVRSIAIPLSTGQTLPATPAVSNEWDTFFAAIEFIFPHSDRLVLSSDAAAGVAPIDLPTLVAKYRLDEDLIKLMLEDWAIKEFDPDNEV